MRYLAPILAALAVLVIARIARADAPAAVAEHSTRAHLFRIAKQVESSVGGWPGLAEFLDAVGWAESRWTLDAVRASSSFGPYQITAVASDNDAVRTDPKVLFDPVTSVVVAADLAYRLQRYADPGQTVRWSDIRRGWKHPILVSAAKSRKSDIARAVDRRWHHATAKTGHRGITTVLVDAPKRWPGQAEIFRRLKATS